MSGVCYTFRSPKATQLGLNCFNRGVNQGMVSNLQYNSNFFDRANMYKSKEKNIGIVFCEGSMSQEAPNLEPSPPTTAPPPIQEPQDGFELLQFYKKSDDVLEFLKNKFTTSTGNYNVVAAFDYISKKFEIFSKFKRGRNMKYKISIIFEQLINELKEKAESLFYMEKATVLKSLGLANLIVYSPKYYQFTDGRELYVILLNDILKQGDFLTAEDIFKVSSAINNFRQYDDTSQALSLFKIIKNDFEYVNKQQQIRLLDSIRLLRCYNQEIQDTVEWGIVDKSFMGQTEEEIKSIFLYLGTMGCNHKSNLEILANQYLQLSTQPSIEVVGIIIYNLAWLGAEPTFIQNFVDQTLKNFTCEDSKNFVMKNLMGNLRRAQRLLEPSGYVIKLPGDLQQSIEEDLQREYLSKQIYPNERSKAAYEFLKDKFVDCSVQSRPAIEADIRTDMSIIKNDKKIAVEIRRATSFSLTQPKKLLGYTKATFQAMENKGWKVVCVEAEKFLEDDDYKQSIADQITNILESETEIQSLWKQM